jgi:hypothetical protein
VRVRVRMSNLNLNLPVDDRNGIGLQRNFAGHAGRFTRGDVEGKEHSTILPLMMPSSDSDAAPWVHISAVAWMAPSPR